MISLVLQSHDHEGSPGVGEALRWKEFVEKVGVRLLSRFYLQ